MPIMSRSLNIVFIPMDAIGHVNACIGLAQVLVESGHRVVFVVSSGWKGRLVKYGIEEVILPEENGVKQDGKPASFLTQLLFDAGAIGPGEPLHKAKCLIQAWEQHLLDGNIKLDKVLDELLPQLKPDLIMVDQNVALSSVERTGLPWVQVCSCNPLRFIENDNVPPFSSGLGKDEKEAWIKFRAEYNPFAEEQQNKRLNKYLISRECQPISTHTLINRSPYLNIYGYPLELDYIDMSPLPENYYRFDNLKRSEEIMPYEIPEQLKDKPGKLIYLSMGTMGGKDVLLMKRLIAMLADCRHRFIVAKGPMHDKYELADNMWGQPSVPQIQVLPVVDLVITHGGNNTVCETFFFGKPLLVLPIFGDQFDNAKRIEEKCLGLGLNPYTCSKQQLLESIDKLLNDKQLYDRLKNISKRIQRDNSIAKLPDVLVDLVNKLNIK